MKPNQEPTKHLPRRIFKVQGLHCTACAATIELDLEDRGIVAKCNFAKQTLEVENQIKKEEIRKLLKPLGYDLG